VEAITAAVNVEAFMPCSAADTQYASTALTCAGSGSPRQRVMNRSVIVEHSSMRRCGTAARRSAARLRDVRQRHHRRRGELVAGLSSAMSSSGR
jgi:hypothetical protein